VIPRFIMHAGYKMRRVEFVLSRERNGWKFYGRDSQGYLIPAKNRKGQPLGDGVICETREEAARMARVLELPAYATWNGRKRAYDGKGTEFLAVARDQAEVI
jgi:hypothetical protein